MNSERIAVMAYNKSDDEVRHYCRNPRCRSKLPAPANNPRQAFCTRGCYDSFYLHRCLVCEEPIEQPKRGRRLICKKIKCRKTFRRNSCLGRYHRPSNVKITSENTDSTRVKEPLKSHQPCSAFHCATVGADEAVERADRVNASHWRGANAKAEEETLIKRQHPPVNVLGGHKFPGAPVIDLTPIVPPSTPARSMLIGDLLDVPDFLRRTDVPTAIGASAIREALGIRKRRQLSPASKPRPSPRSD